MFNRRKFLKSAAMAPVAAPVAAKAAVTEAMMSQADVRVAGQGRESAVPNIEYNSERASQFLDFIDKHGLPEWKKRQMLENAAYIRAIDPDLAAMHSFSFTAKMNMQKQRNFDRAMARIRESVENEGIIQKFEKMTGFSRWEL